MSTIFSFAAVEEIEVNFFALLPFSPRRQGDQIERVFAMSEILSGNLRKIK
jgi:hypothetical protein